MADEAPEIKVRLTAEDTGVAAAIKELGNQLKTLKKSQDDTAASAFSLRKAFDSLAGLGALISLERLGKNALDAAVNIGNMAEKTGLSTETLSVFHKVAQDVGVSTESVDRGLVKAAKSITQFEQGSKAAAQGFALLGLRQKDFIGLNSDQKIQKVAEALGKMPDGFSKTTAAQLIFSKSGAELIPVLNSLASQGFDKATEATRRLGLLLGGELVENARVANEALQRVEEEGAGLATQFEAGLLPALADASLALGQALNAGDDGIKTLGEDVGAVAKFIAEALIDAGKIIGAVLASVWVDLTDGFERIKIEGVSAFEAIAQAARGNLSEAVRILKDGARDSEAVRTLEVTQQKTIYRQLFKDFQTTDESLFPRADEEKAFADREQITQKAISDLKAQEAGIRDRLLKGLITQQQAEQQIKNLLAQQIPLIQAKAQEELRYAEAQGHAAQIARARATVKQVDALIPRKEPPPLDEGPEKISAPDDAAHKAALAFEQKLADDELAIHRDLAKKSAQVDQEMYERGELSLREYYSRRRAAIAEDAAEETAILRRALVVANEEVRRTATVNFAAQREAAIKHEGATPRESARLDDAAKREADRAGAAEFEALTKVEELRTRITQIEIKGATALQEVDAKEAKESDEALQKEAAFQKEIAVLRGNTQGIAQAEIEEEAANRTLQAKKEAGSTEPGGSRVDLTERLNEIEIWKQLKLGVAAFDDAEKKESEDQKEFDLEKQSIEIQERNRLISKTVAERQITNLTRERLPLLMREAQEELAIANATKTAENPKGNQEQIARAQQTIRELQNLSNVTDGLANRVNEQLTGTFDRFFGSLLTGTRTVAQAFGELESSAIGSLEHIASQMISNLLTQKALAEGTKLDDAEVAAANVYAQVSAIPVIGWVLAPAAAAAAFAAVLAFEQGGLVPGDLGTPVPILAHAQEMVLPADISKGLQFAINAGGFKQPSPDLLSSPLIQASSGDLHQHNEFNLHHNGPDAREILQKELVPMIHTAMRRGKIRT